MATYVQTCRRAYMHACIRAHTQALVQANNQLAGLRQLEEELNTWKREHAGAAERLQRALAERDAAREAKAQEAHRSANVASQLDAAQAHATAHSASLDDAKAAERQAIEKQEAAEKTAGRRHMLLVRAAVEASALSAELAQLEACLAAVGAGAATARGMAECERSVCISSLDASDAELAKAIGYAGQSAQHLAAARAEASAARAAVAEATAARAKSDEAARSATASLQAVEGTVLKLTAERDSAKRIADSLRLELKKAMHRQVTAGDQAQ